MTAIKSPIATLTNPALTSNTRVRLKDGREGRIVDRATHRAERLLAFPGVHGVHMIPVMEIARAWPSGEEKVCVFDGRSLAVPAGGQGN